MPECFRIQQVTVPRGPRGNASPEFAGSTLSAKTTILSSTMEHSDCASWLDVLDRLCLEPANPDNRLFSQTRTNSRLSADTGNLFPHSDARPYAKKAHP
jgi:hypothetical protein